MLQGRINKTKAPIIPRDPELISRVGDAVIADSIIN